MERFFNGVIVTLILILCVFIISFFINPSSKSYSETSVEEFNALKAPVVLIAKNKSMGAYNITVKDADNKVLYIGNMSGFANSIGASRMVGDTLK